MSAYQTIMDTDAEAGLYPSIPSPSLSPSRPVSVYSAKNTNTVTVKAKLSSESWGKSRYRQFEVPVDFPLIQFRNTLKEKFDLVDETGADAGTAYLLWFFLGFLGVHRWYLKQHNGLSWTVWFLTGQLFFFGWAYDGVTLYSRVKEFNSRSLNRLATTEPAKQNWLGGFKEDSRPSMVVAYVLWFFFGWAGIHRWYTGYHTPSSYVAWLFTFQIFGFGWLYDAYFTSVMVNYPRLPEHNVPFFIKSLHKYDYLPVVDDEHLGNALSNGFSEPDRTVRFIIINKKREDVAYIAWFTFGVIGGHAWYLGMGNLLLRFFTGNYFFFGYVAEGIRLQEEIDRANKKLEGDFVPSLKGTWAWPSGYHPVGNMESFETV